MASLRPRHTVAGGDSDSGHSASALLTAGKGAQHTSKTTLPTTSVTRQARHKVLYSSDDEQIKQASPAASRFTSSFGGDGTLSRRSAKRSSNGSGRGLLEESGDLRPTTPPTSVSRGRAVGSSQFQSQSIGGGSQQKDTQGRSASADTARRHTLAGTPPGAAPPTWLTAAKAMAAARSLFADDSDDDKRMGGSGTPSARAAARSLLRRSSSNGSGSRGSSTQVAEEVVQPRASSAGRAASKAASVAGATAAAPQRRISSASSTAAAGKKVDSQQVSGGGSQISASVQRMIQRQQLDISSSEEEEATEPVPVPVQVSALSRSQRSSLVGKAPSRKSSAAGSSQTAAASATTTGTGAAIPSRRIVSAPGGDVGNAPLPAGSMLQGRPVSERKPGAGGAHVRSEPGVDASIPTGIVQAAAAASNEVAAAARASMRPLAVPPLPPIATRTPDAPGGSEYVNKWLLQQVTAPRRTASNESARPLLPDGSMRSSMGGVDALGSGSSEIDLPGLDDLMHHRRQEAMRMTVSSSSDSEDDPSKQAPSSQRRATGASAASSGAYSGSHGPRRSAIDTEDDDADVESLVPRHLHFMVSTPMRSTAAQAPVPVTAATPQDAAAAGRRAMRAAAAAVMPDRASSSASLLTGPSADDSRSISSQASRDSADDKSASTPRPSTAPARNEQFTGGSGRASRRRAPSTSENSAASTASSGSTSPTFSTLPTAAAAKRAVPAEATARPALAPGATAKPPQGRHAVSFAGVRSQQRQQAHAPSTAGANQAQSPRIASLGGPRQAAVPRAGARMSLADLQAMIHAMAKRAWPSHAGVPLEDPAAQLPPSEPGNGAAQTSATTAFSYADIVQVMRLLSSAGGAQNLAVPLSRRSTEASMGGASMTSTSGGAEHPLAAPSDQGWRRISSQRPGLVSVTEESPEEREELLQEYQLADPQAFAELLHLWQVMNGMAGVGGVGYTTEPNTAIQGLMRLATGEVLVGAPAAAPPQSTAASSRSTQSSRRSGATATVATQLAAAAAAVSSVATQWSEAGAKLPPASSMPGLGPTPMAPSTAVRAKTTASASTQWSQGGAAAPMLQPAVPAADLPLDTPRIDRAAIHLDDAAAVAATEYGQPYAGAQRSATTGAQPEQVAGYERVYSPRVASAPGVVGGAAVLSAAMPFDQEPQASSPNVNAAAVQHGANPPAIQSVAAQSGGGPADAVPAAKQFHGSSSRMVSSASHAEDVFAAVVASQSCQVDAPPLISEGRQTFATDTVAAAAQTDASRLVSVAGQTEEAQYTVTGTQMSFQCLSNAASSATLPDGVLTHAAARQVPSLQASPQTARSTGSARSPRNSASAATLLPGASSPFAGGASAAVALAAAAVPSGFSPGSSRRSSVDDIMVTSALQRLHAALRSLRLKHSGTVNPGAGAIAGPAAANAALAPAKPSLASPMTSLANSPRLPEPLTRGSTAAAAQTLSQTAAAEVRVLRLRSMAGQTDFLPAVATAEAVAQTIAEEMRALRLRSNAGQTDELPAVLMADDGVQTNADELRARAMRSAGGQTVPPPSALMVEAVAQTISEELRALRMRSQGGQAMESSDTMDAATRNAQSELLQLAQELLEMQQLLEQRQATVEALRLELQATAEEASSLRQAKEASDADAERAHSRWTGMQEEASELRQSLEAAAAAAEATSLQLQASQAAELELAKRAAALEQALAEAAAVQAERDELHIRLVSAEATVKAVSAELQVAQVAVSEASGQATVMQQALASATAAQEEAEQLRQRLTSAEAVAIARTSELQSAQAAAREASGRAAILEQALAEAQRSLENAAATAVRREQQAEFANQDQQRRAEELENTLQEALRQARELEVRCQSLQSEAAASAAQAAAAAAVTAAQAQSHAAHLQAKDEELRATIDQLALERGRLAATQEEAQTLRTRVSTLQLEVSRAEVQLPLLQQKAAEAEARTAAALATASTLRTELATVAVEAQQLREHARNDAQALTASKEEIHALQQLLEDRAHEVEALKAARNAMQQQALDLGAELDALESETTRAQASSDEAQSHAAALRAQLAQARQVADEARRIAIEREEDAKAVHRQQADLEAQLMQARARVQGLEGAKESLTAQLVDMASTGQQREQELAQLRMQLNQALAAATDAAAAVPLPASERASVTLAGGRADAEVQTAVTHCVLLPSGQMLDLEADMLLELASSIDMTASRAIADGDPTAHQPETADQASMNPWLQALRLLGNSQPSSTAPDSAVDRSGASASNNTPFSRPGHQQLLLRALHLLTAGEGSRPGSGATSRRATADTVPTPHQPLAGNSGQQADSSLGVAATFVITSVSASEAASTVAATPHAQVQEQQQPAEDQGASPLPAAEQAAAVTAGEGSPPPAALRALPIASEGGLDGGRHSAAGPAGRINSSGGMMGFLETADPSTATALLELLQALQLMTSSARRGRWVSDGSSAVSGTYLPGVQPSPMSPYHLMPPSMGGVSSLGGSFVTSIGPSVSQGPATAHTSAGGQGAPAATAHIHVAQHLRRALTAVSHGGMAALSGAQQPTSGAMSAPGATNTAAASAEPHIMRAIQLLEHTQPPRQSAAGQGTAASQDAPADVLEDEQADALAQEELVQALLKLLLVAPAATPQPAQPPAASDVEPASPTCEQVQPHLQDAAMPPTSDSPNASAGGDEPQLLQQHVTPAISLGGSTNSSRMVSFGGALLDDELRSHIHGQIQRALEAAESASQRVSSMEAALPPQVLTSQQALEGVPFQQAIDYIVESLREFDTCGLLARHRGLRSASPSAAGATPSSVRSSASGSAMLVQTALTATGSEEGASAAGAGVAQQMAVHALVSGALADAAAAELERDLRPVEAMAASSPEDAAGELSEPSSEPETSAAGMRSQPSMWPRVAPLSTGGGAAAAAAISAAVAATSNAGYVRNSAPGALGNAYLFSSPPSARPVPQQAAKPTRAEPSTPTTSGPPPASRPSMAGDQPMLTARERFNSSTPPYLSPYRASTAASDVSDSGATSAMLRAAIATAAASGSLNGQVSSPRQSTATASAGGASATARSLTMAMPSNEWGSQAGGDGLGPMVVRLARDAMSPAPQAPPGLAAAAAATAPHLPLRGISAAGQEPVPTAAHDASAPSSGGASTASPVPAEEALQHAAALLLAAMQQAAAGHPAQEAALHVLAPVLDGVARSAPMTQAGASASVAGRPGHSAPGNVEQSQLATPYTSEEQKAKDRADAEDEAQRALLWVEAEQRRLATPADLERFKSEIMHSVRTALVEVMELVVASTSMPSSGSDTPRATDHSAGHTASQAALAQAAMEEPERSARSLDGSSASGERDIRITRAELEAFMFERAVLSSGSAEELLGSRLRELYAPQEEFDDDGVQAQAEHGLERHDSMAASASGQQGAESDDTYDLPPVGGDDGEGGNDSPKMKAKPRGSRRSSRAGTTAGTLRQPLADTAHFKSLFRRSMDTLRGGLQAQPGARWRSSPGEVPHPQQTGPATARPQVPQGLSTPTRHRSSHASQQDALPDLSPVEDPSASAGSDGSEEVSPPTLRFPSLPQPSPLEPLNAASLTAGRPPLPSSTPPKRLSLQPPSMLARSSVGGAAVASAVRGARSTPGDVSGVQLEATIGDSVAAASVSMAGAAAARLPDPTAMVQDDSPAVQSRPAGDEAGLGAFLAALAEPALQVAGLLLSPDEPPRRVPQITIEEINDATPQHRAAVEMVRPSIVPGFANDEGVEEDEDDAAALRATLTPRARSEASLKVRRPRGSHMSASAPGDHGAHLTVPTTAASVDLASPQLRRPASAAASTHPSAGGAGNSGPAKSRFAPSEQDKPLTAYRSESLSPPSSRHNTPRRPGPLSPRTSSSGGAAPAPAAPEAAVTAVAIGSQAANIAASGAEPVVAVATASVASAVPDGGLVQLEDMVRDFQLRIAGAAALEDALQATTINGASGFSPRLMTSPRSVVGGRLVEPLDSTTEQMRLLASQAQTAVAIAEHRLGSAGGSPAHGVPIGLPATPIGMGLGAMYGPPLSVPVTPAAAAAAAAGLPPASTLQLQYMMLQQQLQATASPPSVASSSTSSSNGVAREQKALVLATYEELLDRANTLADELIVGNPSSSISSRGGTEQAGTPTVQRSTGGGAALLTPPPFRDLSVLTLSPSTAPSTASPPVAAPAAGPPALPHLSAEFAALFPATAAGLARPEALLQQSPLAADALVDTVVAAVPQLAPGAQQARSLSRSSTPTSRRSPAVSNAGNAGNELLPSALHNAATTPDNSAGGATPLAVISTLMNEAQERLQFSSLDEAYGADKLLSAVLDAHYARIMGTPTGYITPARAAGPRSVVGAGTGSAAASEVGATPPTRLPPRRPSSAPGAPAVPCQSPATAKPTQHSLLDVTAAWPEPQHPQPASPELLGPDDATLAPTAVHSAAGTASPHASSRAVGMLPPTAPALPSDTGMPYAAPLAPYASSTEGSVFSELQVQLMALDAAGRSVLSTQASADIAATQVKPRTASATSAPRAAQFSGSSQSSMTGTPMPPAVMAAAAAALVAADRRQQEQKVPPTSNAAPLLTPGRDLTKLLLGSSSDEDDEEVAPTPFLVGGTPTVGSFQVGPGGFGGAGSAPHAPTGFGTDSSRGGSYSHGGHAEVGAASPSVPATGAVEAMGGVPQAPYRDDGSSTVNSSPRSTDTTTSSLSSVSASQGPYGAPVRPNPLGQPPLVAGSAPPSNGGAASAPPQRGAPFINNPIFDPVAGPSARGSSAGGTSMASYNSSMEYTPLATASAAMAAAGGGSGRASAGGSMASERGPRRLLSAGGTSCAALDVNPAYDDDSHEESGATRGSNQPLRRFALELESFKEEDAAAEQQQPADTSKQEDEEEGEEMAAARAAAEADIAAAALVVRSGGGSFASSRHEHDALPLTPASAEPATSIQGLLGLGPDLPSEGLLTFEGMSGHSMDLLTSGLDDTQLALLSAAPELPSRSNGGGGPAAQQQSQQQRHLQHGAGGASTTSHRTTSAKSIETSYSTTFDQYSTDAGSRMQSAASSAAPSGRPSMAGTAAAGQPAAVQRVQQRTGGGAASQPAAGSDESLGNSFDEFDAFSKEAAMVADLFSTPVKGDPKLQAQEVMQPESPLNQTMRPSRGFAHGSLGGALAAAASRGSSAAPSAGGAGSVGGAAVTAAAPFPLESLLPTGGFGVPARETAEAAERLEAPATQLLGDQPDAYIAPAEDLNAIAEGDEDEEEDKPVTPAGRAGRVAAAVRMWEQVVTPREDAAAGQVPPLPPLPPLAVSTPKPAIKPASRSMIPTPRSVSPSPIGSRPSSREGSPRSMASPSRRTEPSLEQQAAGAAPVLEAARLSLTQRVGSMSGASATTGDFFEAAGSPRISLTANSNVSLGSAGEHAGEDGAQPKKLHEAVREYRLSRRQK